MPSESRYAFGEFRLDAASRVLFRAGEMLALYPKAIDVLIFLVESQGHVATKEKLLEHVWPGIFVEESTLTRSISVLRKALGDTPEGHAYIFTVPKRGYRFVAPVRKESGDGASRSSSRREPIHESAPPASSPATTRKW